MGTAFNLNFLIPAAKGMLSNWDKSKWSCPKKEVVSQVKRKQIENKNNTHK